MNIYFEVWLCLIDIKPASGFNLKDLAQADTDWPEDEPAGVIAWVLVRASDIRDVLDIIPQALAEQHFELTFIDSIQNAANPISNGEIGEEIQRDIDLLLDSDERFMITGSLYPYMA